MPFIASIRFSIFVSAASTLLLSGCMNLSGLDAKKEFTCEAPDGVSCMSISGVAANVDRNNLPKTVKQLEQEELARDVSTNSSAQKPTEEKPSDAKPQAIPSYGAEPVLSPANMLTLGSGTPVRVPPKELRIWMAPTEDTDGDLNEQRYIYVVVNDGRWMVDATRINPRSKYTNFQPLLGASPTSSSKPAQKSEVKSQQSVSQAGNTD